MKNTAMRFRFVNCQSNPLNQFASWSGLVSPTSIFLCSTKFHGLV